MALSYRLEKDLLTVVAEGDFGLSDVEKVFHRALADPACPAQVWVLVDARRAVVNPPVGELRDTARFVASLGTRLHPRLALVVERDLLFGLGRMLGTFAERHGLTLETFRDLQAARAWLAQAPPA